MEVGFLDKVVTQIVDYLEVDLGATDLDDFAGLKAEHLGNLLKLVPPLKLDKFKKRLACYCPVSPPPPSLPPSLHRHHHFSMIP